MEPPNMVKWDNFKRIQSACLSIGNKNYSIFKGVNTVGRNIAAIVNIKHLNVSQNQAIIVVIDETQHFLSDMNSSNGTFIHNAKLIPFKLYEITDQAEIKFGDVLAVYSKEKNTTINLQETLDASEMTQNMTQNFYASDTQLILTKREVNEDNNLNVDEINKCLYDIHEEATQVINNPKQLPNTQEMNAKKNIAEQVLDDIHEASTQVLNNPLQLNNQMLHKENYTEAFQESFVKDIDIHLASTKTAEKQKNNKTCEALENTETTYHKKILEEPSEKNLFKPSEEGTQDHLYQNNEDSSTQVLTSQEHQELIERITNKNQVIAKTSNTNKSSSQQTKPLSLEETQQTNDINNRNKIEPAYQKKNIIHNSQIPSTSTDGHLQAEYDDSFIPRTNVAHNVLEESVIENPDSNDSIDFLEIDKTQDNVGDIQSISKMSVPKVTMTQLLTDNSQLSTCSAESDICRPKDRSVPHLPTVNSDDETDIDDTQDTGFKKEPIKKLKVQNTNFETDIAQENRPVSTLPTTQTSTNSDDDTDIDDTQEIGLKRKPIKKLESQNTNSEADFTQENRPVSKLSKIQANINSDDDTDNDDTQEIGFKKKPIKKLESQNTNSEIDIAQEKRPVSKLSAIQANINSDDDTDIDDTQEIGFRKRNVKPLESQNTNSETGVDNQENNLIKIAESDNSDSETDCEDEILRNNRENESKDKNSGFGIEDNLDDTDCIPATQDAFAEALGYKSMKSQTTFQSSEESFKLGLTELMEFSEKNDNSFTEHMRNDKNQNNEKTCSKTKNESELCKSDNITDNTESKIDKNSETNKEDIYLMPTQKIQESSNKKFTFKKKSTNLEDSLTTILSTKSSKNASQDIETIDDIFLQPTQKMKHKNSNHNNTHMQSKIDDGFFLQPTQKLDSEGFVNKSENNTNTQKIDEANNDIYFQPTQKLDYSEISVNLNQNNSETQKIDEINNEIFLEPTQDVDSDGFVKPIAKNYVFLQPTVISVKDNSNSKIQNTQDEDVYLASTQILRENNELDRGIVETQEDLYGQATQKIEIVEHSMPNIENKNVYEMATQKVFNSDEGTQKLSEDCNLNFNVADADTQLEMPFSTQNINLVINEDSDRPKNPIIRELEEATSQDNEHNSPIEKLSKENISDASTFKEPAALAGTNKMIINDVETLSQIEAFIKKPLPPSISRRSVTKHNFNKSSDKNSETISKIETFIKKPLHALNLSTSVIKKTIAEEEGPESLSQIAAFVNKPISDVKNISIVETSKENKNKETTKGYSRRISKLRSSNNLTEDIPDLKKLEVIKEDENKTCLEQSSKSDALKDEYSEEDIEKKDTSKELKSDVDQSFALLESKSTKIRRKPKSDPVLDEIKVVVTSHRRSMSTAENPKRNIPEIIPTKKSRRNSSTNVNKIKSRGTVLTTLDSEGSDPEEPIKVSRTRSRTSSTKREVENKVNRGKVAGTNNPSKINNDKVTELLSRKNKVDESIEKDKEKQKIIKKVGKKQIKDSSDEESDLNNVDDIKEMQKMTSRILNRQIVDSNENDSNEKIVQKTKVVEPKNDHESEQNMVKRTKKRKIIGSDENENKKKIEESKVTKSNEDKRNRKKIEESKQSASTDDSDEIPKVRKRSTKGQNVNPNKDINRNDNKESEDDLPRASKRTSKRQIIDSYEDDFVQSRPCTPAKRGRIASNIAPFEETERKSRESSSDSMTTPRKGRNAPKTEGLLMSAERLKRRLKPKVVFTMLDSPQLESYIKHLGGSIVDTVDAATVLVTQSVKRSQKLLTAVAQGKPICSVDWIHSSKKNSEFLGTKRSTCPSTPTVDLSNIPISNQTNVSDRHFIPANFGNLTILNGTPIVEGSHFPVFPNKQVKISRNINPWDHILIDEEAESKWNFSLRESIIKGGNINIFSGYVFQLMVTNALDVLKAAIESSGGKIVSKFPVSNRENCIIIASPDQKSKYTRLKKQHPEIKVLEPEAIFDGVLRQEFRVSRHLLA